MIFAHCKQKHNVTENIPQQRQNETVKREKKKNETRIERARIYRKGSNDFLFSLLEYFMAMVIIEWLCRSLTH